MLDQLQRYLDAFGHLGKEYEAVHSQMKELGLVANRNATVDPDKEPIPVLMLAGVPVKKLGAEKDSTLLHALRAANEKKLAAGNGWDARLLVFPRHMDQSFSIPTSLQDLPTIEDWCARNLSET